ncbi:Serine/threonine-protein kinase tel1 [Xylographa trunciseda]|nr:Serine/threonine-protein kinase tel1 [Xylographa trunciseda]
MSGITLNTALERIKSTRVKERTDGLADLKHILEQNRRNPKLHELNDDGFHTLFEALFRVTQSEKLSNAKSSGRTKAQSDGRLSTCASLLRLAVKIGVCTIRKKTVRALIDHITQTLPSSDDQYLEPLLNDYVKALRTVLEHQPHLEHLSKKEWHGLVDFCNDGIQFAITVAERSTNLSTLANGSSLFSSSSTPSTMGSSLGQARKVGFGSATDGDTVKILDDFALCLSCLLRTTNAVIMDKAASITDVLLALLQASATGSAHQAAFMSLNLILIRCITEDVDLVQHTFKSALPYVRRLWQTKSGGLKEEMLITLIYGENLMPSLLDMDDHHECRSDLQGLLDMCTAEYIKRAERDQLQLDDLDLSLSFVEHKDHAVLGLPTIRLRLGTPRSEWAWASLHVIATIFCALFDDSSSLSSELTTDRTATPQKRRKITNGFDTLLKSLTSSPPQDCLLALKLLTFISGSIGLDQDKILQTIEALSTSLSSDNYVQANWSMIAMACAAAQTSASATSLRRFWLDAWQLTARNISTNLTCRAACHLMAIILERGLVGYADIVDIIDKMLSSVELNGPSTLCDSSVDLWKAVISIMAKQNPAAIQVTSERILRWLFVRWRPSQIQDRHQISQLSRHCEASSIIKLISVVLRLPFYDDMDQHVLGLGPVAQAILRSKHEGSLVKYLLLDGTADLRFPSPKSTPSRSTTVQAVDKRVQDIYDTATELLIIEISAVLKQGPMSEASESQGLSANVASIMSSLCVVAFGLPSANSTSGSTKSRSLVLLATQLRTRLIHLIPCQQDPQTVVDGVLDTLGLLLNRSTFSTTGNSMLKKGALATALPFNQDFWQELLISGRRQSGNQDLMEIDQDFESQNSSTSKTDSLTYDIEHEWLCSSTGVGAKRASLVARICQESIDRVVDLGGMGDASVDIKHIEYLTSLPPDEFLACRFYLRSLFNSSVGIDNSAILLLLEYLGTTILEPYEYERCEVAQGVCLDLMTFSAVMWLGNSDSAIADRGSSLYEWFIKVFSRSICSPHVHQCLSLLLQSVVKIRPDYAKSLDLPSARTSLFQILEEGTISVKFFVGTNISGIFGHFILKEHEAILEDVINSLPTVRDWTEGIALRLFVLAHLGSSWSTLLRRCIYAIFETAGQVSRSIQYAKSCLALMAKALHLHSSKELFRLFASQIIFTWLESEALDTIPYDIFGYPSLASLLTDIQDEVTGQVVMRGREDEALQLATLFSTSYEHLLETSFSKCAAYCIARDAATPPDLDAKASGADIRLRKILGKDRYGALITRHFPEIMAIFYGTMDREDHIVKGFQSHETYAVAQNAYDEMVSYGASIAVLPAGQQPSFKAGYLMDQISYLYSRSAYDIEDAWPPALYTFIFRSLLNSIHEALGSLHTCSAIRKVRILICMAGDTALKDYALEMALHALRPFLVDTHCAEDSIGITRYLITHGTEYLKAVPSFLAGLTVSTLAAMRKFLHRPQESTTQESHYLATMSRAQDFHIWLGHFADDFSSPDLRDSAEISFKAIVHSASQLRGTGNACKGTAESALLLELLKDRRADQNLVAESSLNSILGLLCASFEVPAGFRDDILGADEQAAEFVDVVWRSCQHRATESDYLLWVGRVLGRAYGGTGTVPKTMLREVQIDTFSVLDSLSQHAMESSSRRMILHHLSNILLTESRRDIGLAERTLQIIVSKAGGNDILADCEQSLPVSLLTATFWGSFPCPRAIFTDGETPRPLQDALIAGDHTDFHEWIRNLCVSLVSLDTKDKLLSELKPVLLAVKTLPEQLCPYIIHLVLLREANKQQKVKQILSYGLGRLFNNFTIAMIPHLKLLLHSILYLRTQILPQENTQADRSQWLDLDYEQAATTAVKCNMHKTALLFLEIGFSESIKNSKSRRASNVKPVLPNTLLLQIFRNLDDKDSFYGIRQPSSLSAMMEQLEFENSGFKSLSFRSADYDSQVRRGRTAEEDTEYGITTILDTLDLNSLSQSMLSNLTHSGTSNVEAMLRTARKLERWDIPAPATPAGTGSIIFKAFQDIHNASDDSEISTAINLGFQSTLRSMITTKSGISSIHEALSCLAVLTEMEDVFFSQGIDQVLEVWAKFEARNQWMLAERLDNTTTIISCRQTLFSTMSKSDQLRDLTKISQRDARKVECRSLLASTALSRHHGALQSALSTATYMSQMVPACVEQGIAVDAAIRLEGTNVLWDQQEMSASIRMLQDVVFGSDLQSQDIYVGKPELLAKLGHRISEARLEKPDQIIASYLLPAIKELHDIDKGHEAGQVFHEFASFCDKQLQNNDNLEDFQRIQRLRERKELEVMDLEKMIEMANSQGKEQDNLKSHLKKAQQWFGLDDREYQRLKDSREAFLAQSLENYLLSLRACDNYDADALRFSALWLEHYENEIANNAASKYINHVGSRKFAPLMNQWTSRLLDASTSFQTLLSAMVFRICLEHPYHGMYQIFASSKTKGGKDQAALARNAAAVKIVNQLKSSRRAAPTWLGVHNSNINFVRFATEKVDEDKHKPGTKVLLRKSPTGLKLEQDIPSLRVPPPTMRIPLRLDCDYGNTPTIVRFQSEFTIASGISMPKILTAIGSDGRKYKQLFKGGNDDLRQDSIMEQVFDQVSNLLKSHRNARQRHLAIRTYKVVPLTSTSGLMEFVSNTVPLHDYLMPAHQRYFPGDLKPNVCRKYILDVQKKSVDIRVKTFRAVCDKFHPVMRFFFMEHYENPDDWFERRLAYTRSTAAISILGYILGLGDRHGHNILVDEQTGEVVHIDLGIAFEQGRVLTVPEVVPFRLTRDLVDGMGITGTEGGFRRCCEFTMEALRDESYSIMTILDVLRYDPLYSWSLSPLRLKKLQENQAQIEDNEAAENVIQQNEPGEADRALTVVAKKLSKSLSVTATVNELIQQATDERNLALLFCGWAAYA